MACVVNKRVTIVDGSNSLYRSISIFSFGTYSPTPSCPSSQHESSYGGCKQHNTNVVAFRAIIITLYASVTCGLRIYAVGIHPKVRICKQMQTLLVSDDEDKRADKFP